MNRAVGHHKKDQNEKYGSRALKCTENDKNLLKTRRDRAIWICLAERYKNSVYTFSWLHLLKIEGHIFKDNFFVSRWINKIFDDYFQEFFSLSNKICDFAFWSFFPWFVQVTTYWLLLFCSFCSLPRRSSICPWSADRSPRSGRSVSHILRDLPSTVKT